MMFLNRSRDRPVRHLEWRIRIFGVGAILAVVGMWSDQGWLINVAIGVLAIGLFLRFLPRERGLLDDEDDDDEDDDDDLDGSAP